MCRSVMPLTRTESCGDCEIGGKARNLPKLIQAGLPVPDSWVVPAEEFGDHLAASDLAASARAVFAGGEAARGNLHEAILSMELHPRLLQALAKLPELSFAVRSSASVEGGIRGSYSGLFRSLLGVDRAHLPGALKEVWASVCSPEVLSYHRQVAPDSGCPAMAVLIMPMLDALVSGVAFSADPSDGNPFRICINTCLGLGTRIVDGSESGARYVLDFDTLGIVMASPGHQTRGDFLQADGRVITQTVNTEVALSADQLLDLGSAVRTIDEAFDRRVDVEFSFTGRGLAILQAREIAGLPRFFPGDPTGELCGTPHTTWTDPLTPLCRALLTKPLQHQRIPAPPWPMESTSISCLHGRSFGHWLLHPPLVRDLGSAVLREMEAWEAPDEHFLAYHEWTEDAYGRVLPPLRQGCTRLLSLSESQLARLEPPRLAALLKEALDLEQQAHVFYVSSSWPTSHYVELTETLLQDWLRFASPPPRVYSTPAEQLAMELVQGTPTLTHARDMELQQIALGSGDLHDYICRWGYSYILRDEQLYLDRWRSWREDSRPLQQAIEQMQCAVNQRPLAELLGESRARAEESLSRTIRQLAAIDPARRLKRAHLLTACVRFGRAHFRMKDDRDLVWSHAQAALRWVLLEVARRLAAKGAIVQTEELFLFTFEELLGFLGEGKPTTAAECSLIAEQGRRDQQRLARYTLAASPSAVAPAPPEEGTMIGIPTGAGIAEGKAHLVREATALVDLAGLEEGDILVFIGEGKVGLTMFFPQIGGLVYSNGNGFCHEVNILRELGKPAIVSVGDNACLIEEGEPLRIDAGKGTVTRLQQGE